MKKAPCAKLTIRMMPKINVRPTPRKNSSAACDSAFRHWVIRKPRKSITIRSSCRPEARHPRLYTAKASRGCRAFARHDVGGDAHCSTIEGHLPAGRRYLITRERGDDLRHRGLEPVLLHHLHDVAALHRLVVAGAHCD